MPAPNPLTTTQLVGYLSEKYGSQINADHVREAASHFGIGYATTTKRLRQFYVQRGTWNIEKVKKQLERQITSPSVIPEIQQNLKPVKDPNFVPFGNFSDVKKIIASKLFYPTFITGLSGNGKTLSVEQACSQLGRELVRVNITIAVSYTHLTLPTTPYV